MSKKKLSKRAPAAPKAAPLDVAKAHTDLAAAIQQHRQAGDILADAIKREAALREVVSQAQATFDAAVEQVRAKAAPFDTTWWNSGRRG